MTSISTNAKAVSNGNTTETPEPAQRVHGISRLREDECYHLTSLIGQCLGEAEHLVRKLNGKAMSRMSDYDGSKNTQPLDRAAARKILDDAYECASLALSYIYSTSMHLRDGETESPAADW